MAFVWKHPQSRFWYARFKNVQGTYVNRSTSQVSRRKALAVAKRWEEAARLAADGRLGVDRAQQVIDDIMREAGMDVPERVSVEKMLRDWLREIEADRSEQTSNRYRGVVEGFLGFIGDRAGAPVQTLASSEVQRFIASRAKSVAAKTAHNDLRCLSAAFNRAMRLGLVTRNPCVAVEPPRGRSMTRKPFTAEQVRMLVEAAPTREWKALIKVLWFTGLRIGDGANLEWSEIDLANAVLTRTQGKTGGEVIIPLHPDLAGTLAELAGDKDGPVLPSLAGRRIGGKQGLSAQFGAIVRAAGLDEERQETKAGRSLARYSAHSLRHGSISAMANAGVPAEIRRKISGHADERSHQAYSHHAMQVLRAAIAKLPSIT